jgi:hypothetical protein
MHIYYAVDRDQTTGTLEAGSDATDARFWTPAEFEASDESLRPMPNPDETRSWKNLETLLDVSQKALQRNTRYSELIAPSDLDI